MSDSSKIFEIPEWARISVNSLLQALKMKDEFTFYHCCRVGRAARRLARDMGLDEYEQDILEFSGLLHDIGKLGIPDSILLKPGRLDSDEVEVIKNHAELSCEIVKPFTEIPFFRFLMPGIRYHHERFDGKGYPHGLAGEKIPLAARIIAVVDTVDAMTNTRPYRKALSMEIARQELIDHSGTQFDHNIVEVYLEASKSWKDLNENEGEERVVDYILSSEPLKKAS